MKTFFKKNLKRVGGAASALLLGGAVGLTAASSHALDAGVTDDEIVIGTIQDLSGPLTFWGKPAANGMQMRVDEINAAGGIHGRKLRLVVEDHGYDPKKSALATQKLLGRDKVFAVIGTLGSQTTLVSMKQVLRKDTLHLFPLAPIKQTFEPFDKHAFSLTTTYTDSMQVAARYMVEEKKKKRFGVLFQDDVFGKTVLRGVIEKLADYDMKVVEAVSYKRGATDFSSQIARLKSADVDVVMLGTIIRETIGAQAEAKKIGWDVDMIVSHAGFGIEVAALGKGVVEGLYATGQFPIIYPDEASGDVAAFLSAYQERFGSQSSAQSQAGYVMIDMFATAVEKAGRDLTTETAIKALEDLGPYADMFGAPPVDFSSDVHYGTDQTFVAQIKNGRWVKITDFLDP